MHHIQPLAGSTAPSQGPLRVRARAAAGAPRLVSAGTGDDPRIGSTVAGYRIDVVLGRGGMGVVYRAHQERRERDVALKEIAPELARDEAFRERFIRESRAAAAIEHSNVVPIYEADELGDGTLYLAIRYIPGSDLRQTLTDAGALDAERTAAIITSVAAAANSRLKRRANSAFRARSVRAIFTATSVPSSSSPMKTWPTASSPTASRRR